MPPPKAPSKPSKTEKKTPQTGLMEELDAPRPGYVTPKKTTGKDYDPDLTSSPVKSVEIPEPTEDEVKVGESQEKYERGIKSAYDEAKGKGRKSRKHKKSKKSRKTRKVKKHGKRRH